MKIGTGVQAILKFYLSNLGCCNVRITDWRDLRSIRCDGLWWHDIPTKFHQNWFRHSSNYVITATVLEATVLVLLMRDLLGTQLKSFHIA
jgi:hypothetical protein